MAALVSECDEIFSKVAASQSTEISKQQLTSTKQSLMDTHDESKHAGTQDKKQFTKLIISHLTDKRDYEDAINYVAGVASWLPPQLSGAQGRPISRKIPSTKNLQREGRRTMHNKCSPILPMRSWTSNVFKMFQ